MAEKQSILEGARSNAILGAWQGLIFGACVSLMEIPYERKKGSLLRKSEIAKHVGGRMAFCPVLMAIWSVLFRFNDEKH
jgi:hypothetical protein